MSLISKDKVMSGLADIKEHVKRKEETIEVQMLLKGYDYKKDVRFDSNVVLPHAKRLNEKILIIADRALEEKAKELGLEYKTFEEVEGKSKEKQKIKKKLAMQYHSFIASPNFNTAFEVKIFNRKKKPVYVLRNANDLESFYADVQRMVKFKLRKTNDLSFTIGHCGMDVSEIYENFNAGLGFLATLLKKGYRSVGGLVLKSCQGKPVRIY